MSFRPNTYVDVWTPGPPDVLAGKGSGSATIALPWDTRAKVRPVCAMALASLDAEVAAKEVEGGAEFELPEKVFGFASKASWLHDKDFTRLVLVLDRCPTFPHPGLPINLSLPPDVELGYQPALTPAEIDEGCERSEHVVGSYAAYGRFGKVGHFYPGWWTDAKGEKCKAELAWDGRRMMLTLPQKWMQSDGRAWPVIKNLAFGLETEGASSVVRSAASFRAFGPYTPASSGTLDSVEGFMLHSASTATVMGIYDATGTDGMPGTKVAQATAESVNVDPKDWLSQALGSQAISSASAYWIAWAFDVNTTTYYDSWTGNHVYTKTLAYNATLPTTFPTDAGGSVNRHSFHAHYTLAATGHPAIRRFGGVPFARQQSQGVQVW